MLSILPSSTPNTHPRRGFLLRKCQLELQDSQWWVSTSSLLPSLQLSGHGFGWAGTASCLPGLTELWEFIVPGHMIGGHVTIPVQEEAMSSSPVFSEKLLVAVAGGWFLSRIFCAHRRRERASLRIKLTQRNENWELEKVFWWYHLSTRLPLSLQWDRPHNLSVTEAMWSFFLPDSHPHLWS